MKLNFATHSFIFILILLFISHVKVYPQELDITPQLKKIEAGQKDDVIQLLSELKTKHPIDASVMYLEGLLTEDGEKAVKIYQTLVNKYPRSKYADDAVYRIYSYFSAADNHKETETYLNKLKFEYPESPYIKLTESVVFGEKKKSTTVTKDSKTVPIIREKKADFKAKYTIQAGAFSSKENAQKLKTDFDKAGYSSQVVEKSVGGSLFHVVYVGKYASDAEAKSFLKSINSAFKLQGWVVKLD